MVRVQTRAGGVHDLGPVTHPEKLITMKNILLLSDLHVGSLWGLWPPDFETDDPRSDTNKLIFRQNQTQKKLWAHWKEMINVLNWDKPVECIIFNGDLIDGQQRRNIGRETVTSRLDVQTEAAIEIIETLPDVPKYFTQGTEYHSLPDGSPVEAYIAKQCNGEFGDDLLIDECGIRLHVGHPITVSSSSWQYRTTPLARDLLLLALNAAEERYGKVNVVVRSHAHYFCTAGFSSQIGIITPCWQTRTPYAVKKNFITPPDIGYVILRIENQKNIMIDRSGIINQPVRPCRVVGRDKRSRK